MVSFASASSTFSHAEGASLVARNSLAIIMAMPLVGVLGSEVYPWFSAMPPTRAVVVFGAVGGVSGLAAQTVAGQSLERLNRPVNIVELLPAVLASVVASLGVTWAFLPPNPNPGTTALRWLGDVPSA